MGLSSVAFCFVLLATLLSSCSYFSEEKGKTEELPSVFFSNWDPTSTPVPPTSTPVPPTPTPVPPTPTPVPPTPTPLPLKSVQSTSIDSGVQKALQSQGSESQFILDQSSIAMSDLRSYQFVLSGTALLDAGGLPMKVPITSVGKIQDDKASSNFETSLIGMVIPVQSFQSGGEIYVKDPFMGRWSRTNGPAAGLISYDFWRSVGREIFNLPFSKVAVKSEGSQRNHHEFELGQISDVGALFALLGLSGAEDFDIKDVTGRMKIEKNSYHVLDIQCGFVIEQGGKFVSEILGLTGLSGLGESKIDIDVEFMGFDEDIEIIIPVGLE